LGFFYSDIANLVVVQFMANFDLAVLDGSRKQPEGRNPDLFARLEGFLRLSLDVFSERHRRIAFVIWKILLVLAAAGLLCVAYGVFIESRWYRVKRYRLNILPPGSAPLSVLHLSDLH